MGPSCLCSMGTISYNEFLLQEASPGEKRPASTSLLTSAAMPSKRIKTEDLVSASSTSSSVASRSSRVRPNVAIKATKVILGNTWKQLFEERPAS